MVLSKHKSLEADVDVILDDSGPKKTGSQLAFNGPATIAEKAAFAVHRGAGGVMIWEAGQDCRVEEVVHADGSRHVTTCPHGEESSLLHSLKVALDDSGAVLWTTDHPRSPELLGQQVDIYAGMTAGRQAGNVNGVSKSKAKKKGRRHGKERRTVPKRGANGDL